MPIMIEKSDVNGKGLLGHPKGFMVIAFTELCERFSNYGVLAILVLYMCGGLGEGGLGWQEASALMVLGIYRMTGCLTAVPGGFIADRWLGARVSVSIGAFLNAIGDMALSLPMTGAFFTGLALIAIGGGFYKPNITTVLGRLYKQDDPHKEAAFTIFYLAVNVGSLISFLLIGWIAQHFGWRMGFLLCGLCLLFGQLVYLCNQRNLRRTDLFSREQTAKTVKQPLTSAEWKCIWVILFSFIIEIVFMAAYEQGSGLLTLYVKKFTDCTLGDFTVPIPWFNALNPIMVIIFAPMLAALWTFLGSKKKDPSAIFKMGLGTAILGLAYVFMVAAVCERDASAIGKSSMIWIVLTYLFCTIGELAQSPVALSFITSFSPQRMVSQIMGWHVAVCGIACFAAAQIGSIAGKFGEKSVFIGLLIGTTLCGIVLCAVSRKIMSLAKDH